MSYQMQHWMGKVGRVVVPALVAGVLVGCGSLGGRQSKALPYSVVTTDGACDVRQYDETLIAQTTVSGDFAAGREEGVKRLSAYLYGKNLRADIRNDNAPIPGPSDEEGPFDGPRSASIASSAPVIQEPAGEGSWTVAFLLPAYYTLRSAPQPMDPRVVLRSVPERKVASLAFAGALNETIVTAKSAELQTWIDAHGHRAISPVRAVSFDPAWTISHARRNEVQVDLE